LKDGLVVSECHPAVIGALSGDDAPFAEIAIAVVLYTDYRGAVSTPLCNEA
jgi:hypothetical protein